MAKLIDILKEIKVVQPLNKRKVFEDMLNFDEIMLIYLIQHDTLNEFVDGYDSLKDMLEDDFNITDTDYITKINNYYNAIKPGDITLIGSDLTSMTDYKNAITLTNFNDKEKYFIATKF